MPEMHDEHPEEQAVEAVLVDDAPETSISPAPEESDDAVLDAEVEEGGGRPSVSKRDKQRAHEHAKKAASADEVANDVPAQDAKPKRQRKPLKPGTIRRVVLSVIALVLVAALVCVGLFCWQKWMRYDDAAGIQGVWKVQSTGDTIVFDGQKLKLTRGISYEYELDTDQKTISYQFGDLEGGGRYYFGAGRDVLVIIDGEERLGLLAEVGFLSDELVEHDDASDNITVLKKVSDDTAAEPSGTATGVSAGATLGEREYVVQPEPSSSSSSSKKKTSRSTSSSDEDSDEEREHKGFVDEDGDGLDDYTDLDYEEFTEMMAESDEDGETDASEDADEDADSETDEAEEGDEAEDEGAELDEDWSEDWTDDSSDYEQYE